MHFFLLFVGKGAEKSDVCFLCIFEYMLNWIAFVRHQFPSSGHKAANNSRSSDKCLLRFRF